MERNLKRVEIGRVRGGGERERKGGKGRGRLIEGRGRREGEGGEKSTINLAGGASNGITLLDQTTCRPEPHFPLKHFL